VVVAGSIVIDSEDRDRRLAPRVDNGGLAWQREVPANALVGSVWNNIGVRKESSCGVVACTVGVCISCHSGLDERWVDAGVVGEGGDVGNVGADSVTERKDATSLCVGDELLSQVGSKLSSNSGWIFETRRWWWRLHSSRDLNSVAG
jgi:hypothetical protein